jgi:hypothetical protein
VHHHVAGTDRSLVHSLRTTAPNGTVLTA